MQTIRNIELHIWRHNLCSSLLLSAVVRRPSLGHSSAWQLSPRYRRRCSRRCRAVWREPELRISPTKISTGWNIWMPFAWRWENWTCFSLFSWLTEYYLIVVLLIDERCWGCIPVSLRKENSLWRTHLCLMEPKYPKVRPWHHFIVTHFICLYRHLSYVPALGYGADREVLGQCHVI
jgi:hypothetical protein